MHCKKNEKEAMSLSVTEGLTVTILPNSDHEFLMPTKEVAKGYDIHPATLRRHIQNHTDELVEGKHFLSGVQIMHAASPGSSIGTLWTKRGIVRLGFFIKSQRARLFRDWAEDLIIKVDEQKDLFGNRVPESRKSLVGKGKHNRLSPQRLIDLLADVALVEDPQLRHRIIDKLLMKGGQA